MRRREQNENINRDIKDPNEINIEDISEKKKIEIIKKEGLNNRISNSSSSLVRVNEIVIERETEQKEVKIKNRLSKGS